MGALCDPYPDNTSRSQRKWVYRRDDLKCQMPVIYDPGTNLIFNICGQPGEEVHHIWPKRAIAYWQRHDPHTPENLILLCKIHHWLIHPDIREALRNKKMGNPNALDELFEKRRMILNQGEPYWITTWDDFLKKLAVVKTKDFLTKNPKYTFPKSFVLVRAGIRI